MLAVLLLLEEKIENNNRTIKENNYINISDLNFAMQPQLQRKNKSSHLEMFLENSFSIE